MIIIKYHFLIIQYNNVAIVIFIFLNLFIFILILLLYSHIERGNTAEHV